MNATKAIDRSGLAEDPQADRSYILGCIHDEYCQRRRAGEALDPEEFCRRYPNFQDSVRRFLEVCEIIDENPRLVQLPPQPAAWPEPGDTVLGYQLGPPLGSGAFARVFLANETALGERVVVVKVSLLGTEEAGFLGKLAHPNIVPIHSMQVDERSQFTVICMPYLGSATLEHVGLRLPARPKRARAILEAVTATTVEPRPAATEAPLAALRRGTYTEGVAHLGAQLAEALAFVHAQGICHRDLKPSNVLLSVTGRPLLMDFNLSMDQRAARARPGGTLAYLAPEQLQAVANQETEAPIEPRSDVFALGVILYQLLAGAHPFGPLPPQTQVAPDDGPALQAWLIERQRIGPFPLHRRNPQVDRALAGLIERCLALEPIGRPTAAELASDLRRYLSSWRRKQRWVARHPWAVLGLVCLVLGSGIAGAIAWANRPTASESHWQQGHAAYQHGDYRLAVQHFHRVLETNPERTEAMFARGRAYHQLGELRLALADYNEVHRLQADGRTAACVGYCFCLLGQMDVAVHYCNKAIESGLASAEVFNNRGFSQLQLGLAHWPDSRRDLDTAVRLDPGLQAAYLNRARYHFLEALRLSDYPLEDGIADIKKAIEIGPLTAELFLDAGHSCAVAGRRDERWHAPALAYLERAVAHGYDPRKLANDPLLSRLSRDRRLQELLRQPVPPSPAPPAVRVVDPIKDISP